MGVFSDPHCRYLGTNCGSGFNQIGGHEIKLGVLRSSHVRPVVEHWLV